VGDNLLATANTFDLSAIAPVEGTRDVLLQQA